MATWVAVKVTLFAVLDWLPWWVFWGWPGRFFIPASVLTSTQAGYDLTKHYNTATLRRYTTTCVTQYYILCHLLVMRHLTAGRTNCQICFELTNALSGFLPSLSDSIPLNISKFHGYQSPLWIFKGITPTEYIPNSIIKNWHPKFHPINRQPNGGAFDCKRGQINWFTVIRAPFKSVAEYRYRMACAKK